MRGKNRRHRSSNPLRTLWMAKKLIAAAVVLGILLWFVLTNNQQVTLYFPFKIGNAKASIGVVVLVSAGIGALITGLLGTFFWAWHRYLPGKTAIEQPATVQEESVASRGGDANTPAAGLSSPEKQRNGLQP